MPKTLVTRMLITRLVFAYASAVVIIVLLLTLTQGIIQYTLAGETATRNLATTMSLQELRTQGLLRNAILAILPEPYQNQLNSLHVSPVATLKKTLADVEATNQALLGPQTPTNVSSPMKALQSDFNQMDQAGRQVLAFLAIGDRKSAGVQVAILFVHEQKYLIGTYNAYTVLTQSADQDITHIQIIEGVIYGLSLIILCFEVFFIVWPVMVDYKRALKALEEEEKEHDTKESTISAERAPATIPSGDPTPIATAEPERVPVEPPSGDPATIAAEPTGDEQPTPQRAQT